MKHESKDCSHGGLVKHALAGLGLGQVAHGALCPLHGLMGLLLKTGAVGGSLAAPFVAAHHSLVYDVATPAVAYVRGDDVDYANVPENSIDSRTYARELTNPNVKIAHNIVDYSGWGLAVGVPLAFVGAHYRKKRDE